MVTTEACSRGLRIAVPRCRKPFTGVTARSFSCKSASRQRIRCPSILSGWYTSIIILSIHALQSLTRLAELFHAVAILSAHTQRYDIFCSVRCVYGTPFSTWLSHCQVRYDARRGFFVQGLFEVEIRGLSDIMAVVDEGNGNRRVSSHLLNKDSSRSHSLLTVYLQNERKDSEDGHLVRTFGKVLTTLCSVKGSRKGQRACLELIV